MIAKPDWDFARPFTHSLSVLDGAIDRLGHVNNARYLEYLEATAWAHSESLGLNWMQYQQLGTVVVAARHEIDYLRPAFAQDELMIGTWCTGNDAKLRMRRHYQIVRSSDAATLVRAQTIWICADLNSGRPKRMPDAFKLAFPAIATAPSWP
jgi:acyl-CoA thioester hydrolase